MNCQALNESEPLARLILELEQGSSGESTTPSKLLSWREAAFICEGQSLDAPGDKRLWVVPRDAKPGDKPEAWIRSHAELFSEWVDGSVARTNVVFPGEWPKTVERHYVNIETHGDPSSGDGPRRRRVRRDVRALSAASHLWVDRETAG